jgi:hypothetical protein
MRAQVMISIISVVILILLTAGTMRAEVITYPVPVGETTSTDYSVWADNKPVFVYRAPPGHGGAYSFTGFDASGTVTVKIVTALDLTNLQILPKSSGVTPVVQGDTITLTIGQPMRLSVEPYWIRAPLLLFVNPIEQNPPKQGDPGVVYYGPGISKPNVINLSSNQTLYLAGGAVVQSAVSASGTNIRIMGRGILDGTPWQWQAGPAGNMISINSCRNVLVEGITIRASWGWTIVPRMSDSVKVSNVKICNSKWMNDDGINPVNSRHVTIEDCFIRTDDDCIAMKGMDGNRSNVEDIQIKRCVLWCDRARIILMGHESRANYMRNILVQDVDIIHRQMTPFLLEPGENMYLRDVRFENIRIWGWGDKNLGDGSFIVLRPTINQYMQTQAAGYIRNVTFKNIRYDNIPVAGVARIIVQGYDAQHTVDSAVFDNVTIADACVTSAHPQVDVLPNTSNINFICASANLKDKIPTLEADKGLRMTVNRHAGSKVIVSLNVPQTGQSAHLAIYDIRGRCIRTLAFGYMYPGIHTFIQDLNEAAGGNLLVLRSAGFEQVLPFVN